jgi:hypothetical protein
MGRSLAFVIWLVIELLIAIDRHSSLSDRAGFTPSPGAAPAHAPGG